MIKTKARRFLLKIMFSLFLIGLVQNCGQGCLKCNKLTKLCDLCDGYNSFVRVNGNCQKIQIDKCIMISEFSGNCLICEEDYYVLNGKCVSKGID